jgi:AraC-like DNA-binding protein
LKYRSTLGYFTCDENESRVELDLARLETPKWWYFESHQNLTRQDYKLDRVPKITLGSSFQSPVGVISKIDVSDLELNGRDRRYLFLCWAVLLLAWGGFGTWFFLKHSSALINDVKSKLQKDLPFVAYQQLSLKPHRDKEKTTILQYIATNYSNAELDVDMVVEQTSVNRNKIFDVLKSELGFTFSGYLNKLRLTEAARLLAEQDAATVAEIAFSVGYGNISYFNKLFKEEYGCTPKAFRSACKP